MSGSYKCKRCWAQIRIGEICSCNDVVTKMTDTYDVYCDKCGHLTAVLSHTCEDELAALRAENERLEKDKELLAEEISALRYEITGLNKPCPCCDAYWAQIPRPEGEES